MTRTRTLALMTALGMAGCLGPGLAGEVDDGPQGLQGTPGEGFYGYPCAEDSQCNAGLACSTIGICLLARNEGCLRAAQCATDFCSASSSACRALGARIASLDFDTLAAAGNTIPLGFGGFTLLLAVMLYLNNQANDRIGRIESELKEIKELIMKSRPTAQATGA